MDGGSEVRRLPVRSSSLQRNGRKREQEDKKCLIKKYICIEQQTGARGGGGERKEREREREREREEESVVCGGVTVIVL